MTMMDYSDALRAVKAGGAVARIGWNGKNMYITLKKSTHKLERDYVVMKGADGLFVPWLCSQTDMLAEDWVSVTLVDS